MSGRRDLGEFMVCAGIRCRDVVDRMLDTTRDLLKDLRLECCPEGILLGIELLLKCERLLTPAGNAPRLVFDRRLNRLDAALGFSNLDFDRIHRRLQLAVSLEVGLFQRSVCRIECFRRFRAVKRGVVRTVNEAGPAGDRIELADLLPLDGSDPLLGSHPLSRCRDSVMLERGRAVGKDDVRTGKLATSGDRFVRRRKDSGLRVRTVRDLALKNISAVGNALDTEVLTDRPPRSAVDRRLRNPVGTTPHRNRVRPGCQREDRLGLRWRSNINRRLCRLHFIREVTGGAVFICHLRGRRNVGGSTHRPFNCIGRSAQERNPTRDPGSALGCHERNLERKVRRPVRDVGPGLRHRERFIERGQYGRRLRPRGPTLKRGRHVSASATGEFTGNRNVKQRIEPELHDELVKKPWMLTRHPRHRDRIPALNVDRSVTVEVETNGIRGVDCVFVLRIRCPRLDQVVRRIEVDAADRLIPALLPVRLLVGGLADVARIPVVRTLEFFKYTLATGNGGDGIPNR